MTDKNKTLNDFFKYFAGDLFVKGFMFISLPLLSRVMSPDDYGKMSLLNAAIMILYVFISLNLQNAVINSFMKNDVDFPRYLGTIIIGLVPTQLFLVLLCPFYAPYIAPLLSISVADLYWVLAICIMLSYIYIYTSYLQGARLSSEFVKLNAISKIIEIFLIFLIAYLLLHNKYLSKVYAQIIVNIFVFIYIFRKIREIATFEFDKAYFKMAMMFSVPLMVHVLSNSLLSQADRLIISKLMGDYSAGIYSFSYNLGMCVIIIITAWNSSWQPKLYSLINANAKKDICRVIYSSSVIVAILSFFAILFSKEIVIILADRAYHDAINIIPVIIFGNALIHVYLSYVNFTFFHKKTMWVSLGTLMALLVNIVLNYMLIPIYGITGAAWATVGAYFLLAFFQYLISKYVIKENPLSILLLIIYSTFFMTALYVSIEVNKLDIVHAVTIKIIISVVILVLLYKSKIYNLIKV
ncbi:polysaccharide biosynthesis protein [Enterobacteriaceae bacterium 4M9]|nr:polysaccharide biosynthesis protein [Enterobacteriaceae bacterium 4M9]